MPEVTHLSWENHAKKPSWFQNRWTFPVEKKLQKHPCLETTTFTYIYVMHTLVGETTSNPPQKKNALDSQIPIKSMGLVSTPYMKTHYQIMRNSCRLNIPNSSPWESVMGTSTLGCWKNSSAKHRGFLRQIFHAALLWSAAGVRLVVTRIPMGTSLVDFTETWHGHDLIMGFSCRCSIY